MTTATIPSVAILLLAAGKASRMGEGGPHKLLATFDGVPLVRRMAEQALLATSPVIVVTGHRHPQIAAALTGLAVEIVYNAAYESGIGSSIVAGFAAPSTSEVDGVMVMLADMPAIRTADLEALIREFCAVQGAAIVRAVSAGRRGNPVILPRSLRAAVQDLKGDVGARPIIESCGLPIVDVEIGAAAHIDVDTPDAVIAAGGILKD